MPVLSAVAAEHPLHLPTVRGAELTAGAGGEGILLPARRHEGVEEEHPRGVGDGEAADHEAVDPEPPRPDKRPDHDQGDRSRGPGCGLQEATGRRRDRHPELEDDTIPR